MELLILLWLGCGVLATAISQPKGEGFLGLLLGCTLGPIGVAIALMRQGRLVPCAHCRALIDQQATVCRYCTRDV
ncbi:MAG: hypothetical protein U0836_13830 [Pirellulales bacterium]